MSEESNSIIPFAAAGFAALASLFGGFIGAWAAASFSNRNFYAQHLWERRAESYSSIFEALHDMEHWFEVHLRDIQHGRDTDEAQSAAARESYKQGKAKLDATIARETWIVPDDIRKRLIKLDDDLIATPGTMWAEVVEDGANAIFTATRDLRELVRKDLLVARRS
jgi:hypothetical protein